MSNPSDQAQAPPSMPTLISVVIIGAGIGGLSAAIALIRLKERGVSVTVTVLEAKPQLSEFGASISITPQAVRIIKNTYGLEHEFTQRVMHEGAIELRDGTTNALLGAVVANRAHTSEIRYGEPKWTIHRGDYQRLLARGAVAAGVRIVFDAEVASVDLERHTVFLRHGSSVDADLIVGADGLRSVVRASMMPTASGAELVELGQRAFRCQVDKARMRDHPTLKWLLTAGNSQAWLMPGAFVLGWPMPEDKDFDVVACVVVREPEGRDDDVPLRQPQDPGQRQDPRPWGVEADAKAMAAAFADFCPTVRDLLDRVGSCVQWRLAELPPLPTCRSPDGATILLGDAWHAMIPHAGTGGSSAIEDGAVLAECVAWAATTTVTTGRSIAIAIADATRAYEALRKPRVERQQKASREGAGFLTAGGAERELRDNLLARQLAQDEREFARPEGERRLDPLPPANMNAPFPSPPYLQWLYGVDVIKETQEYLAERSSTS